MAGRGPQPKDPARRARSNRDPIGTTVIEFVHAEAPALPVGVEWCDATKRWWKHWTDSPQADGFTALDWDFLLDTAMMHNAMWTTGNTQNAAEIRLRVAKFGATPEDRARLRMVFADADDKDEKRAAKRSGGAAARERYQGLRAVPPATGTEE